MLFSALRSSARRSLFSASFHRTQLRPAFRKFSTNPPPPPPEAKSNTGLYVSLALLAAGGATYYVYSSDSGANIFKSGAQSTKALVKFTPTKDDYQKVVSTCHVALEWSHVLFSRCITRLLNSLMMLALTMVLPTNSASHIY
jgi:hypothetical protein